MNHDERWMERTNPPIIKPEKWNPPRNIRAKKITEEKIKQLIKNLNNCIFDIPEKNIYGLEYNSATKTIQKWLNSMGVDLEKR